MLLGRRRHATLRRRRRRPDELFRANLPAMRAQAAVEGAEDADTAAAARCSPPVFEATSTAHHRRFGRAAAD